MKKIEIIKKNREFSEIINKKNRISNKYFSIYYNKGNKFNKYGISIPTKTGNAVIRNRLKRQLKNIITNNKKNIQNIYDYVIIVKKNILDLSYEEMEKNIINLIRNGDKNEKK